jgi:hypothetical protein
VTEHERRNYRNEHISYEVIMLNYTFMRLMTFKPATAENELDRNAFLESFGVHAWNLIEFLSKKVRKNDRNASDYLPSFEPPDRKPIERALFRLQKQILAITTLQRTNPQDKFNTANACELYAWIVPAVLKFQGALGARYREGLNSRGQVDALLTSLIVPYKRDEDADAL